MPTIKGIYLIFSHNTNHFYIGQSKSIYCRFSQHRKALNENLHHNKTLQEIWNNSTSDNFTFKSLFIDNNIDQENLKLKETEFIKEFETKYGEDKRLNTLPHGTLVTESVYLNNRMFYVYNEFGEFVNSFSSARDLCDLLNLRDVSTIYKIVNEWKCFESYKGYRIRKEFVEKLEPMENTFAVFKNKEYIGRYKSQQELRNAFSIKGGGHLTHVLKGKRFKKEYQVSLYKEYLENTTDLKTFYDVNRTAVAMLDAKTKKELKQFISFAEALSFLEYSYSCKDNIKLAIENDLTFLNYKWKYLND